MTDKILDATDTCHTCHFWDDQFRYQERTGGCHRYAPNSLDRRQYGRAMWPQTEGRDSCGEYVYYFERLNRSELEK